MIFKKLSTVFAALLLAATTASAQTGNWVDYRASSLTESEDHDTIFISTAEELALYAYYVNNDAQNAKGYYSARAVELQADIDLSAHYWTPIGNRPTNESIGRFFCGRFIGNRHTITGMNVTSDTRTAGHSDGSGYGFFGYVRNNSNYGGTYIDRLRFKNCKVSGNVSLSYYDKEGGVGIVVGCMSGGTLKNCLVIDCEVNHTSDVTTNNWHGAIVGYCKNTQNHKYSQNYYYNVTGNYGGGSDGVDSDNLRVAYTFTMPAFTTTSSNKYISANYVFYTQEGQTVTLTPKNRTGYVFDSFESDDVTITAVEESSSFTFTMPSKDITITSNWKKLLTNTDISVGDIAAQTYTGSALTPAVTVEDGSTTLTEGVDYTVSYHNNINASSSAKVIISGKGNYKDDVEKMFTINPAAVTLTANSGTKTYNGSTQSVTGFTISVAGLTFTGVSASGSGKNAGTYDVTFSGVTVNETKDASGNYVVSGLTNGILTINPAAVTLTANSGTKTYNGNEQTVTGFTSSVAGLTFEGVSASGSGKNAGKYDVTFSGVTVNETKDASGNYVVSGLTNGILTINPKTHSGSYVPNIAAQTYTGSAITPSVTVEDGSTTLTEGVDYTVAYSNNINASSSAKVIISGKGNYKDEIEKMFTINPASVTLTANSDTKTYNGSTQSVTGFTSSVAGLTFEGVSASGSGNDAGKYDVTFSGVTVNETKDASGNYVISGLTNGKLTINPAAVTVTADDKEKLSGTDDPEFTATVDGLFGNDAISYTLTREDGEAVGTYTITPAGDEEQGNYTITYVAGTLTINANTTPTAITDEAASTVKIFAKRNIIVVENAESAVYVYDVSGHEISSEPTPSDRNEIRVNAGGIYIVKVGKVTKQILVK